MLQATHQGHTTCAGATARGGAWFAARNHGRTSGEPLRVRLACPWATVVDAARDALGDSSD